MPRNIIFYFSGTGNSLKAAKDIAGKLPECDIVSMGGNESYKLDAAYDRIGFVYPSYFQGVPLKVGKFVSGLDLSRCKDAYFFAVVTYGGMPGNSAAQMKELLEGHGAALSFAAGLKMFANYVVRYKMSDKVSEINERSTENLIPIIGDIISKRVSKIRRANSLLNRIYLKQSKNFASMDRDFNVSDGCVACGTCEKVCPVGNVSMKDGRPVFNNRCEQCMACIQYCPKRAINYKDKTQNRGRYTNPGISADELAERNRAPAEA